MTLVQPSAIPYEAQTELHAAIKKSDPESNHPFSVLYTNIDKSFILYMMTPTGTYCTPPGEMGSGCDNATLKVLNTKDNSVSLLTNDFSDGQRWIYINKKDSAIIVSTESSYEIFNLEKPYSRLSATPSEFSSLLLNEYAVSYNPKTYAFLIENVLNGKKINCSISNTEIQNTLKNNFDLSHLSLSPNGLPTHRTA